MEYRSDALSRCLQTLHRNVPSIRGSTILTNDGLIIAAYPPGWDADRHDPTGAENVAGTAALVVAAAERTVRRLEQGALERVLLEGEKGVVAVFPATEDSALAVFLEKDAKIGLALRTAGSAALEIREILKRDSG